MSENNHPVNIPVKKDARTYAQRRRDALNALERRYHPSNRELVPHRYRDDWDNEVNRWINESRRRWNHVMGHAWGNMLDLMPFNRPQLDLWDDAWMNQPALPPVWDRMERDIARLQGAMDTDVGESGDIVPHTGNMLAEAMKNNYEIDEDGKVHFKARFDLRHFSPDDINVSVKDNKVRVHAKKHQHTDTSSSTREYCRVIELPTSVDKSHIQSNLTGDGVLVLNAPLVDHHGEALTFDTQQQLGVRPTQTDLAITGEPGVKVRKAPSGNKVHLEVSVDKDFKPENICVRLDGDRLHISGDLQVSGSGVDTPCMQQFARAYQLPAPIDEQSIKAQMLNNTLVVEADCLPNLA